MSVDGKETEYAVAKDCKWPKVKGKGGDEKELDLKSLARMVENRKDKGGVEIHATVEKKDNKEVVTEVKMEMRKKKDK